MTIVENASKIYSIPFSTKLWNGKITELRQPSKIVIDCSSITLVGSAY